MPSNRGIRTTGIYKVIRHPLYAGYILTNTSFFFQHLSLWNFLILLLSTTMEIKRILIEEEFLGTDPEYVEYRSRVEFRIIPRVW
jgi:protein-S-isoprenylcysteine O-methyltransferase Ste14